MASMLNVVSLIDKLSAPVLPDSSGMLVKSVNRCRRIAVRRILVVRIRYAGRMQTVMNVLASPDVWVIRNRDVFVKPSKPISATTSVAEPMPFVRLHSLMSRNASAHHCIQEVIHTRNVQTNDRLPIVERPDAPKENASETALNLSAVTKLDVDTATSALRNGLASTERVSTRA